MNNLLRIGFILSPFLFGCQKKIDTQSQIIGVKIYNTQSDYQDLFEEWNEIGINMALVSVELAYDPSFRTLASKSDVQVFIILPVFFNTKILKEHPDWYAIDQNGNIAKEEWVEFVSPSNDIYRKQKVDFIKKYMADYATLYGSLTVKRKSGNVKSHNKEDMDWNLELIQSSFVYHD